MATTCTTCQHLKRAEIDRRLAAGEPASRMAEAYGLSPSSVHRHRANCLGLSASNTIKKEAARGTAALALLPEKDTLAGAYFDLRDRIDQIVSQAQQQGSLSVAISGLNSIRQTLDSLTRLAGHTGARAGQASGKSDAGLDVGRMAERLIQALDHEPDLKARIARALLDLADDQTDTPPATREAQVS